MRITRPTSEEAQRKLLRKCILESQESILIRSGELDSSTWDNDGVVDALRYVTDPSAYVDEHLINGSSIANTGEYLGAIRVFQEAATTIMERAIYRNPKFDKHFDSGVQPRIGNGHIATLPDDERFAELTPFERTSLAHLKNNIGYCYTKSGEYDNAIKILEQCIEIRPGMVFARNNLADAYKGNGNLKKAVELYEAELKINPNHPTAGNSLNELTQQLYKK